jgi:hypothetical protein
MLLFAQLICRSKLGAKLSFYFMWMEGEPHPFNAQAGRYLYKKWRCEFCINCTRWNMRKAKAKSLEYTTLSISQNILFRYSLPTRNLGLIVYETLKK